MKKIHKLISMVLTVMLVFALVTPAFAQDVDEPDDNPTVIVVSSKFLNHPVVKLLSGFFSFLFEAPETEEVVEEPEGEPPVEGGELQDDDDDDGGELPETEDGIEEPTVSEEVVASLHKDEKLGFGVITKLLAVLAESKLTCAETGEFCDLTLEMLIEEYKAGMSIGELFAKYGKPEMTGVGQVRKAVEPKVKTNSGKKK
jgi:hypothetical protein